MIWGKKKVCLKCRRLSFWRSREGLCEECDRDEYNIQKKVRDALNEDIPKDKYQPPYKLWR